MLVSELVQCPPDVESKSTVEEPTQVLNVPRIGPAALAVTVKKKQVIASKRILFIIERVCMQENNFQCQIDVLNIG